jgi:single-strand DNA-binding protein
MNKVILLGNLTRDVEVKFTSGDNPLAIGRFTIAVTRPYQKGKDKESDFINCVSFGKTAENIGKYFSKGNKIAVSGRLQISSYTDSNGQKRYSTDVVVEDFDFCASASASSSNSPAPANKADISDMGSEDLPF